MITSVPVECTDHTDSDGSYKLTPSRFNYEDGFYVVDIARGMSQCGVKIETILSRKPWINSE